MTCCTESSVAHPVPEHCLAGQVERRGEPAPPSRASSAARPFDRITSAWAPEAGRGGPAERVSIPAEWTSLPTYGEMR